MITATQQEPTLATQAPRDEAADTVVRRIVMPVEVWRQLMRLANALEETRGIEVDPAQVAVIALEAGLSEIKRGMVKRPTTTSIRRRPGRGRLKLTDEEREQLESWLADKDSVRARQRTIALWLGRFRRRIRVESLRELSVAYDAYNVANFAQNMKKDGVYFVEIKDERSSRVGWRLSRTGAAEAKVQEELALSPA